MGEATEYGIGTGSAGAHWLKGVLDELALWRVALTEEEIKETRKGLSKFVLENPLSK